MKDTLNSIILNRLLKVHFSDEDMLRVKNDNAICHNILKFTKRNGTPLDYVRDIQPVIALVAGNEAFCVGSEGRFQPAELEWDDFDRDFNYGTPLALDEKEEMQLIREFKQSRLGTGSGTVTSLAVTGAMTTGDILKHDFKMFELIEDIRKHGYQGQYKEAAALMSDIAYDGEPVTLTEAGFMWSQIELEAYISRWLAMKKIYRVSNVLEEDFINQKEVLVPTNALQHLPFRSFAIDVSENEILGKYFDSVLVTANEYQGNYVIDCKVFDKAGLVANNGFQISFSFAKEKDTGLSDEYLDNLYKQDVLEYYSRVKKEYAGIAEEIKRLNERRNPLSANYVKMSDKEFEERVVKLTGIHTNKKMVDVSSFLEYRQIPAKKYKQMERFLFCTIFYLCCSNKKTKRRKTKTAPEGERSYQSPTPVVEMEDLGFEMEKLPDIAFGELKLDKEEIIEDSQSAGGRGCKKGSKKKPHLVRGHFHHYRCGKGKQETVYKYTAPYYTGTKNNIVSVTTLK